MAQQRNRKDPETVPSDVAAETFTLGAALISATAAETVLAMLQADDYFNATNRACFQAIGELRGAGNPVDIFSVQEPLGKRLGIAAGELRTYVHQLTEAVPTAAHVEFYARRVKQTANRRRVLTALQKATVVALETEDDEEVALRTSEVIHAATSRFTRKAPQAITARELQVKVLPPVHYVVSRYFPQGLILLHSRPKVGKTRLADVLALSVASGGRFLGEVPVSKAGVLCLFLEDTEQSLQERLNQYLGEEAAPDGLEFFFMWKRIDQGGYADLDAYLQTHADTKLVIIDTLQMVRPARGSQGDIYAEDVAALRQLKDLADLHSACIVVLHHSKKGSAEEDLVDSAGGTSGNTGSADTIMRLRRIPGSDEAVLEGRGRKVRDFSLVLKMDEFSGWQLLGEAETVLQQSGEAEILELLASDSLRPHEIAQELGVPGGTIRPRLRRMAQKGLLYRNRGGWYAAVNNPATGATGATPQTQDNRATSNSTTVDRTPYISGDPDEDAALADLFNNGPRGAVSPDTPVSAVAGVSSVAPVSLKTNGFHPPGELPEALSLDPDDPPEEAELRHRAFHLAWVQGFRETEEPAIEAGEDAWRFACRAWNMNLIHQILRVLGGETCPT